MYRLHRAITQLLTSDPWFFAWTNFIQGDDVMEIDDEGPEYENQLPAELQFTTLQAKFQDQAFFEKVVRLLELLGSAKTASRCHAKMLLMAFMLNHHRTLIADPDQITGNFDCCDDDQSESDSDSYLVGDRSGRLCTARCSPALLRQISQLGADFVSVCQYPRCWFRRMAFMVAYARYAKLFLDWKSKDAMSLIKSEVVLFVDAFNTMNNIKQCVTSGKVALERCQNSIAKLRRTAEQHFLRISRLLGSSKRGKELVHREMSHRRFMNELSKRVDKDGLVFVDWSSKIAVKNQVRMACMQSLVEKHPAPPRVGSREEKHDPKIMSVWHGRYYRRLRNIKRMIGDTRTQSYIPQFVSYVQDIFREVILQHPKEIADFEKSLDMEFLSQQCAFNHCELKDYILYFLEIMIRHASAGRAKELAKLSRTVGLRQPQGISIDMVFEFLDALDNMRVDITEAGLRSVAKPMLHADAKKNELVALINDLNGQRIGVCNLENWVQNARTDIAGILPGDSLSRLDRLMVYFTTYLVGCPNSAKLDTLPETFSVLRLPVLHAQIIIRDTVLAFCVVQFTLSVSRDSTSMCRLKNSFLAVLRSEAPDIVARTCQLIDEERPALTSSERNVLHGLVSRLLSGDTVIKDRVGKVAMERIRQAVQHRLLNGDGAAPSLDQFDTELKQITTYAVNLWRLSLGTYKPIYETLINAKHLWKNNVGSNLLYTDTF
jgi:hypothetical protein